MNVASRRARMLDGTRSARSGLACAGLASLLLGAGCFQPDERADESLYMPWNPPPMQQLDASLQPVFGADAAHSVPPPLAGRDAAVGVQPPPAGSNMDAMFPGVGAADASPPLIAQDSGTGDAASPEDAALAADVGPVGPPPSALSFSVLTKSLGGRYAPRNVGAIWVENASGKWIKTLAVWAFLRERYLTRFRTASGGNRVDAVTGATLSQHTTHAVTWDLTDAAGVTVPDGDYRVIVETTDRDATGDSTEVAFTKGPQPVRLMPPDVTHYVNMSLALE